MIEQIKDILINKENSTSETEKINYSLEVCELVFKNIKLDETQYQDLETEGMIVDSVLLVAEIVKFISQFLNNSLMYLDKDLKGEDWEIEIRENNQKLEELQVKYTSSTKKYQELKKAQQEKEEIQDEINEIQLKIDEYAQIDLETVQKEKEEKLKELDKLEKTEGKNLMLYKRHLEENKSINMYSHEVQSLSNQISKDLDSMDESYTKVMNLKEYIR